MKLHFFLIPGLKATTVYVELGTDAVNLTPTETFGKLKRGSGFAEGLGGSLPITQALCPSDLREHRHTHIIVIIHCVLNTPRHTKASAHGGGGVQPGSESGGKWHSGAEAPTKLGAVISHFWAEEPEHKDIGIREKRG